MFWATSYSLNILRKRDPVVSNKPLASSCAILAGLYIFPYMPVICAWTTLLWRPLRTKSSQTAPEIWTICSSSYPMKFLLSLLHLFITSVAVDYQPRLQRPFNLLRFLNLNTKCVDNIFSSHVISCASTLSLALAQFHFNSRSFFSPQCSLGRIPNPY